MQQDEGVFQGRLHNIWRAETKKDAEKAFDFFINAYEDKYPKATHCLEKDRDVLLSFYDFPAAHWQSIRTTNPIESSFGTIRHRTKRSKSCLTRDGMLHMLFKLGMCAEKKWIRLRGFNYLAKVIEGVKFKTGKEVKTNDQIAVRFRCSNTRFDNNSHRYSKADSERRLRTDIFSRSFHHVTCRKDGV